MRFGTAVVSPTIVIALLVGATPDRAHAQAAPPPALAVSLGDQEIVVAGLPAGGKLAWFSLASEPHTYYVRDVRREGVELADPQGAARIALDGDIPARSVWGFVDIASGSHVWMAAPGFAVEEVSHHGREGVGRDGRGKLARLVARRVGVELLGVRPGTGAGTGAWALSSFDGSPTDGDARPDGSVAAALEEARPLGDSLAVPDELSPGDVILGIDPKTYQVFTVRLPGGPKAGGLS
jgi:hypothetical protein